jgi:ribose transport system ATP-binding protein
MMFGDVTIQKRPDNLMVSDEVVLEVKQLTRKNKFSDISFALHKGEVLGIAGMLGSGRTELLRSIFGADPFHSGEIVFRGKTVKTADLIGMKALGMALTPEDRKREGLILDAPIGDNLCYASLKALSPGGFMDNQKKRRYVERQMDDLQIKAADTASPVRDLSGGNQQKVVVGNWLNTGPSVMIFDEPSRGIDVNAKQQIFRIIWEQSRKGVSCIMVSTELEELLEVCQRILIMRAGRIVGEMLPDEITNEQLYTYCMGGMSS